MQLIRLRDIDGRKIPRGVKVVLGDARNYGEKIAKYIYCPQVVGLNALHNCQRCTCHAGVDMRYNCVWCNEYKRVKELY